MTNPTYPNLFTSRYAAKEKIQRAIEDAKLMPIGFTMGAPRWKLTYKVAAYLRQLGPQPAFRYNEDRDAFRAAYREHLDTMGPAGVAALVWAVIKGQPTTCTGAVLLCFEDLDDPTQWCHRQFFAEWWQEKTGEPVVEL